MDQVKNIIQKKIEQSSKDLQKIDNNLFITYLHLTVDEFTRAVDQALVASNLQIKGFKPGQAPIEILREKYYSKGVENLNLNIIKTLHSLIKSDISIRNIVPGFSRQLDKIIYCFLITVRNRQNVLNLSLNIERPNIAVTDKCVDNFLNYLCYLDGKDIKQADIAQKYDRAFIAIVRTEEYISGTYFNFIIGSMSFFPSIEYALIGKSVGIHNITLSNKRKVVVNLISITKMQPISLDNLIKTRFSNNPNFRDDIKNNLVKEANKWEAFDIIKQFCRQFPVGSMPWIEVSSIISKELKGSIDLDALSYYWLAEAEKKVFLSFISLGSKDVNDTKISNAVNSILAIAKVTVKDYSTIEKFWIE